MFMVLERRLDVGMMVNIADRTVGSTRISQVRVVVCVRVLVLMFMDRIPVRMLVGVPVNMFMGMKVGVVVMFVHFL